MKKIKKSIASLIICGLLLVSTAPSAKAWETWASIPMGIGIEQALDALWAVLLSTMKKAAVKTLSEQIEKMVSGGSGENQIIMDYEDFIYNSIKEESEEYMSDFFSSLQAGATPGERDMLRDVENSLRLKISPMEPKSTLSEIVNSPSGNPIDAIFDQRYGGGTKALLSYEFDPYNNPFTAYSNSAKVMTKKLTQLQDAQRSESIAGQGFATMVSGNKVMPGSIYQHLVATAEASPIDMITNATKWQEVIASFATTLIGSAIKNGISTTSNSKRTNKRRVNRTNGRGYPGILNDIYKGVIVN